MPNSFLFSLRFSSKVFLKIAKISLWFVFCLSVIRLNFFFLTVYPKIHGVALEEIIAAFIAGIRFDILIYGFLLIPIYFLILLQTFWQKWSKALMTFHKLYFAVTWILISALTYTDFFFFALNQRHMRYADYSALSFTNWWQWVSLASTFQIVIVSTVMLGILLISLSYLKSLKWGDWKDEFSPYSFKKAEVPLRILIPLLIIALAARGTVEAHHLELQHSLVSQSSFVNELALNAVWCFDK